MDKSAKKLTIPSGFKRGGTKGDNSPEFGFKALEVAAKILGGSSPDFFNSTRMLDVGCGNKQAEAIISYNVQMSEYVGIDVHKRLIETLAEQTKDTFLEFYHLDIYNAMYNKQGKIHLNKDLILPIGDHKFDYIHAWSLFSHLDSGDTEAYFSILKNNADINTKFIFSTFINLDVETYLDSEPDRPLLRVRFNPIYLNSLLEQNGWKVDWLYVSDMSIKEQMKNWDVRNLSEVSDIKGGQSFFVCSIK